MQRPKGPRLQGIGIVNGCPLSLGRRFFLFLNLLNCIFRPLFNSCSVIVPYKALLKRLEKASQKRTWYVVRPKAAGDVVQGKGCPLSWGMKFMVLTLSRCIFRALFNAFVVIGTIECSLQKVRISNINSVLGMGQVTKGQGCRGWDVPFPWIEIFLIFKPLYTHFRPLFVKIKVRIKKYQ